MYQFKESFQRNIKSGLARKNIKRLLKAFVLFVLLGSLLFLTSGQLDWVMAWIFLVSYIAGLFMTSALLGSNREEIIRERFTEHEDAKDWDRILSNLFSYLTLFLTLPIAGLDKRFHWGNGLQSILLQDRAHPKGSWTFCRFNWPISLRSPSRVCGNDPVRDCHPPCPWVPVGTHSRGTGDLRYLATNGA
jgi:hypothetical protein